MSTPKGWPSSEKESERNRAEFTTIQRVGEKKYGLDVHANMYKQRIVDADLIDGLITDNSGSAVVGLNVNAHGARVGDMVRFMDNLSIGREVIVTNIIDANNFSISEKLTSSLPAIGDEIDLLRFTSPTVDAEGSLQVTASQGPLIFTLDGADQEVTEDTGTPANNRPLPVKLTDVTGDINITAGDLNVQLSHSAASPDSVQIGDGTEIMLVNADGSINIADNGGSLTIDQSTHDNLNANANIQVGDADVANGNPVPVSDAGGSLTIDQSTHDNLNANANIQVGDADVANGNPVPISDAGGTISIDDGAGSITIDQATHDNLNANANIQVGDADVANGNPVPISDAGGTISIDDGAGSLTIDQATHDNLNTNANMQVGDADVANGNPVPISDAGGSITIDQPTHNNLNANANLQIADTDVAVGNPVFVTSVDSVSVVDLLDGGIIQGSTVNGSGGAFTTVVASIAAATSEIQIWDTTGDNLGWYIGPAASEVLTFVTGPGNDQPVKVSLAAAARLSVRGLEASVSGAGTLVANLIG